MWPFSQRAATREDVAKWLEYGRAKPITRALDTRGDAEVRIAAASALGGMDAADLGDSGRSKVIELLSGAGDDLRRATLLGVAAHPQPYNVEAMFHAIEAAGEADRDAAYEQLGAFLFKWSQLIRDSGDRLDEAAIRMAPIVRATKGCEAAYDPLLTRLDRRQNPMVNHAVNVAVLGNGFVDHAVRSGSFDKLKPALRRVGIRSYGDPQWEDRQRLLDSMVDMLRETAGDARERIATVIVAIFAGSEPTLAWRNI